MKQSFIMLLTIAFLYILDCNSQNIDNIRGTNWISLDYIRDMENWLPCECYDTVNYCCYISIAEELFAEDSEDEKFIPVGILNYVVQTEPTQFYIINSDSTRYGISVDSENIDFELTFKGDTLLLIDSIGSHQFVMSVIPFDFLGNKSPVDFENINLFNKSLLSRGYSTIQTILKEDSLKMDCNAWLGVRNMVYSTNTKKSWVLEIKNGYLYIEKVIKHHDPLDEVKTKAVKKMKWTTNGKERLSRKEKYPVWQVPK
ncbi:hypothetical protein FACS189421_13110 [Bacteroidia bacterium]|nr:hypothetical protein FACS189421_13110 [Bacteroidia bacterium]